MFKMYFKTKKATTDTWQKYINKRLSEKGSSGTWHIFSLNFSFQAPTEFWLLANCAEKNAPST